MDGTSGAVVLVALKRVPPDVIAAFVLASCAEQGLAPTITDPSMLRTIVTLLKPSPGRAPTQGPAPRDARSRQASGSPADLHPGGIEARGTLGATSDSDAVGDGANDGVLPVQRQAFPRSA